MENLHVSAVVEAVKLVEQLQHRALDLLLSAASGVVPGGRAGLMYII